MSTSPPLSFLQNYRIYSSGNEAHPTYHIFSGLIALSSIVGRRCWVDMGSFSYAPNLYVILVGPSGNRKTTAMTPAKNIIRALNLPYSAECVTKEKLVLDVYANERVIKDMPKEYEKYKTFSPMTCVVTELSEFLGAGGLGMINFLVTIYDQDYYDIRTKNKGDTAITGPYLCLLACTTPDWITIYLKQDVISGGFSRRAIFVYESTKGTPIPRPVVTPEMAAAWHELIAYAKKLQDVKGPMIWADDAGKFYDSWYIQHSKRNAPHPMLVGYFESKHAQLLKIATLLSLSESFDRVITKRHLEFALELLGLAEVNMAKVFAGMGRNELNPVANKVLATLQAQPYTERKVGELTHKIRMVPEKQLRSMFFHEATTIEMDQVLKHLEDSQKIERMADKHPTTNMIMKVYIRLVE
jgi:Protein of unknown function (DUF3987)